jgi:hypothetical protein
MAITNRIMIIMLALCTLAVAQSERTVAVYMTGEEPQSALGAHKMVGGELVKAISRSGKYSAVNRTAQILELLEKEHGYTRSGAVSDEQIKAIGEQYGVQYLCIVEISKVKGGIFYLDVRLVDVVTATTVNSATATNNLSNSREIMSVAQKLARELVGENRQTAPQSETGVSVGAGGFFASGFGGGIRWASGAQVAMPYSGMGVYLFFDAEYAEAFAGYFAGDGKWESANAPLPGYLPYMPRTCLNFGVFAKYPFAFERVKIFPLLGIDYESSISGRLKYRNGNEYVFDGADNRPDADDMSALWFKFGGGVDFSLGQSVYLRSEFLYGIRTANTFEMNSVDTEISYGHDVKTGSGSGFAFKFGVGVKF